MISLSFKDKIQLEPQLQIEKSIRTISSRFNPKYPQNHVDKIEKCILEIRDTISKNIISESSFNQLDKEYLLTFNNSNFEVVKDLSILQNAYLIETLNYLINCDYISKPDDIQSSREQIIKDLGLQFKNNINEFDE
jgi:hypothetical protein